MSRRTFSVDEGYIEVTGPPSAIIDQLYIVATTISDLLHQATLRYEEIHEISVSSAAPGLVEWEQVRSLYEANH